MQNGEYELCLCLDVLGKGSFSDRTVVNGDTPTGLYKFTGFMSGGDVRSYGPGQRIAMIPIDGEAYKIEKAGTRNVSTIRIHGGKLNSNKDLRPTYGCIRATNEDMASLVAQIKELQKSGDYLEFILITDCSLENIERLRNKLNKEEKQ